ncbi:MAG: TonB-dependent siderophore receptor [Alteromonadaceae bacterium]|nr:TonB-dependent siderophore receptor [Alteromonadaceae bacterium]
MKVINSKLSKAVKLGCIYMATNAFVGLVHAQETYSEEPGDIEKIEVVATTARVATKTDADLTEIPQSISIVTAEQLKEMGAVNFQDIFRYTAGVSTEDNGADARYDSFSSRGFATVQYLDGLNRMPDFIYGARMEVFTLERAEVLRGPSAVLYGAGSAGGLLNAVSKTARYDFGAEVGVQVGTDNRKQLMADVTGSLSDDVAGRMVGVVREGELLPEGQADDRIVAMPSIKWAIGDNTELTVLGLYQKDDMGTHTYYGVDFNAPRPPVDFFSGDKGFNRMKTEHLSGTIMFDHHFSDALTYSTRTRYFSQDTDYGEVYGLLPDSENIVWSRAYYLLDENYHVVNSDHNLSYTLETGDFVHQLLFGIDYTEFRQDRGEGWGGAPDLDRSNADYYADIDAQILNSYSTRSTQLGYYFQDQVKYDEWLSLIVGVRRDKSTSELNDIAESPNTATTVRVGAVADVGYGVSPYIGYSESYQPVFGADFYGVPYQPQEGKQTEVGIKYQPAPGTLITVAYYDVEETNRLTADPDEIQNALQAGLVKSDGFEIEASTFLFGTLRLSGAYSHTNSEVYDNPGVPTLRVENVPEDLASLWVMNHFINEADYSLNAGFGVRYVGDKVDATNTFNTPSVTQVDLSVNMTYDNWSARLNVTNLFDKEYYAICSDSWGLGTVAFCAPGMDRRVMATVTRKF